MEIKPIKIGSSSSNSVKKKHEAPLNFQLFVEPSKNLDVH